MFNFPKDTTYALLESTQKCSELIDQVESLRTQLAECQARLEDAQDIASIALRKAWQLGQTYWQQADSEYASQWKKSDETQAKFYLSTCLLR